MKHYLFLILCLFSSIVSAQPQKESTGNFEFGTLSGPCLYNECTVTFKKKYNDPLVFLMPSFSDGHWNDAPATLRITDISSESAKFRQVITPYNEKKLALTFEGGCFQNKPHHYRNKNITNFTKNNKEWCLEAIPMKNISYFVIDNNSNINLGDYGKILARKILVDKYIKGGESLDYNKYVKDNKCKLESKKNCLSQEEFLSKYSVNIDSSVMTGKYGVVVENQSGISNKLLYRVKNKNKKIIAPTSNIVLNKKYWFTPSVEIYNNKPYISLDRSEVPSAINSKQNIAYLLIQGSGVYKGLKFALGRDKTFDSVNSGDTGWKGILSSPKNQCELTTKIPISFSEKPLLLASKNSRFGTDGGFLRLCQQKYNKDDGLSKISFVTDEDLNEKNSKSLERNHHAENFGFMAFQQVVSPSVCQLFPGPVQTWKESKNGILTLNHSAKIMGAALIDSKRYVGMNVNDPTPDKEKDNCDGEECYSIGDNFELYAKENTGLETKDFNDNINDIDNSKKEYWIDSLWVGPDQIVSFPRQTILHVKNLELNGNYSGLVANLCAAGANAKDCDNANPDDLIIYVHGNNGRVNISNGAFIRGLIYSQSNVDISNGAKNNSGIYGALTAPNVSMEGSSQSKYHGFIYGQSSCFASTPNYTLMLSPDMTSTLCDSKKITFSVNSTNSYTYNGTVSFTLTSASSGEWSTTENFTSGVTKFKSGSNTYLLPIFNNHASIWLRSDGVTTVNINASIENNTVTSTGQYQFSMADDVYFSMTNKQENIIAGKTFNTTITAKICGIGNKAKTLTQYSGPKFLYLKTDYIQPTTPAFDALDDGKTTTPIKVEVITGSAIRATDYLDIKFDKGVSPKLTLKYREAGVIKWQVTDPNYTFEKIQLSGKKRRLTKSISINGVLDIKSRPWTFAICPLTFNGKNEYDNASGTSNGGEAYTAAGKPFDIVAKPLIWQNGDSNSESAMIDVSEQTYCNRPVTKNFFATGAPSLNDGVILSEYGLDSPKKGQLGQFFSQPQMNNNQYKLSGLLIANNSWSEVGSLWVKANLNNYLGMVVNRSRRHIGRFYPDHFMMVNGDVRNAHNELSPFTYMGQPFTTSFTIEAQNKDNQPTTNYGLFNEKLKQSMEILARNQVSNAWLTSRLDQSNLSVDWEKNWNNATLSVSSEPLTFKRKNIKTKTTIADGPYDIALGIHALPLEKCPFDGCPTFKADKDHNVWFWKKHLTDAINQRAAEITGLIHSRYGRMALQDAAGDIGKSLTIPLRIEYWNGAEFVTNSDDSASTFDGANYCRQILIQEPAPHMPNNPTTSGAGKVNLGQSLFSQLMANPDGDFKQQIRFWQRLSAFTKPTQITNTPKIYCKDSASNQPWLSYNWRGIGDEDPSATVTFGVYHGNNRIIYRGEINDTGQSIPYLNYQ